MSRHALRQPTQREMVLYSASLKLGQELAARHLNQWQSVDEISRTVRAEVAAQLWRSLRSTSEPLSKRWANFRWLSQVCESTAVSGVLARQFDELGPGSSDDLDWLKKKTNYISDQDLRSEPLSVAPRPRRLRSFPRGPRPEPQPYGVSNEGAEALVASWMRYLGDSTASVTSFVKDGGADVVSNRHVAQVKNYVGSVSVTELREFVGAAIHGFPGRKLLFFTSGSYTLEALRYAELAEIPLFRYDARAGDLSSQNALALRVIEARKL